MKARVDSILAPTALVPDTELEPGMLAIVGWLACVDGAVVEKPESTIASAQVASRSSFGFHVVFGSKAGAEV